jgi:purine-cytosine permease-like protein
VEKRGGIYWFTGGLNYVGTGVWAIAFAAGLMFTNNEWFTSPGAQLLGGLDTGFLVAGIVAAILYPLALRVFPEPQVLFAPLAAPAPISRG